MVIEPTAEQIAALGEAAQYDDSPVVMINLLAFVPDGAASYQRYGKQVQPLLDRVGATVLYAGTASQAVVGAGDKTWWDAIVVVRYPSRGAFLAMVTSPNYQEVHIHRAAALARAELIATGPWLLAS